jgi:hypothetical protein
MAGVILGFAPLHLPFAQVQALKLPLKMALD